VSLWQDFLAYRLPTYHDFEKKRPHSETPSNLLDINLTDLHTDLSHPLTQIMYGRLADDEQEHRGVFSTYDIERLMEFQLNELQRAGGRLSDSMRMEFNRMARAGAEIPARGHYLNFLDAWRAGDYASASDNLHRLSDYAMQTGEQVSYQYALLNLAVLQADFGAYAEALPAIQEAIAVARENKDTECLNCCMGWIYHFVRAFPSQKKALGNCGILGDEVEGLTFLKSRAKDAEMWALLAGTLINEANLCLQRGDSLAGVFENIAKASHLNINKCSQLMAGQVLLMKGATYSRIGLTRLAWTCAQTFLHCHTAGGASMEELLKSHCRTAGLLVQRGRYAEADAILGRVPAEALRVVKIQTYWDFYARLLKVRRMLHRDDLDGAEYLVDRLRGQGLADVEMAVSLTLLDADLSMRRGDFGQALKLVEALARRRDQDESHDIIVQTRLLNLKARILVESGHPLKGFSIVMRAAQTAYRARLLPSLWESIGLLASILIHLGEYFAAMDLLQSIMPQVLELQDCHFAGRSYATLADAFMGLASLEQGNPTKQKEYISKAMENIDQASQQFRFVEDLRDQRGMLKKKATILHWRGDLMLANDTATQYLELRTQYESQRV
jgi:anaphase-promoting complex subunit 5